jgi:metal-sulfur cluster biosynthetic enzyme
VVRLVARIRHRAGRAAPLFGGLSFKLSPNQIEALASQLGIGIIDMGLIYRAEWNTKGIDVEFTTTSPSCPFEEVLFQDINDILSHRFREVASIRVRLVLDPPWTLERLSGNARRKLGWARTAGESSAHSLAAPGKTKL